MANFPEFFHAFGGWWLVLMSGIASVLMGIYEKVLKGTIGRMFFITIGIICLFFAFYFAWDEQYQKQLSATASLHYYKRMADYKQERINQLLAENSNKNKLSSNAPVSSFKIEGPSSGNAAQMTGSPGGAITQVQNDTNAIYAAEMRALRDYYGSNSLELSKRFSSGYAIFAISQTKEIVPLQMQDQNVQVDWNDSYDEMTRDKIKLHLTNIQARGLVVGQANVSLPRKIGSTAVLYRSQSEELVVTLERVGDIADVLVVGVRPTGPDAP